MKKVNNIIWTLFGVVLSLTLISTSMVSGLFARYTTKAQSGDSARVAAYIFRVQDGSGTFDAVLPDVIQPGLDKAYNFSVTNKSGSLVCETDQTYDVVLRIEGNAPIKCVLKKKKTDSTIIKVIELDTKVSGYGNETYKSCNGDFQAAIEKKDDYILEITWPKEEERMNASFAESVAEVSLTFQAQQVD